MLLCCLLFDVGWRVCAVRCSCSRCVACGLIVLFVFAFGGDVVCCSCLLLFVVHFVLFAVRWMALVIRGLLFVGYVLTVVSIGCYWNVCCLLPVAWCLLFVRCCLSVVCWWCVCCFC